MRRVGRMAVVVLQWMGAPLPRRPPTSSRKLARVNTTPQPFSRTGATFRLHGVPSVVSLGLSDGTASLPRASTCASIPGLTGVADLKTELTADGGMDDSDSA
eukprot:TRINITY_DN7503_c1_g2_i3.p2 TRINITY_DN7503_c1_g2~~TRINITY_DN7503_c1_g2_i3.p2  ORF type:complete len:102 (+),score=15.82 TRINITY_DN7503_c1_g2_i3:78-383(+)